MQRAVVHQFKEKTEAMDNVQHMAQEKSVLRWGGLAGIVGGILFIVVFVIVGVFVGMEFVQVMRFREVRTARIVENSLYLAVLILWIPHVLALYRALRATSLAPALFGSTLSILGLVVLAAESLHHLWQTPISDLYHASGTTAETQATLVLLWQTMHGLSHMLLVTGLIFLPIGITMLGMAMFNAPAFGKAYAWLSVLLGVAGFAAAFVLLVARDSVIAVVCVFALIIFHLIVGWKTYRLSVAV